MDFTLHELGLMKYEIEEIVGALTVAIFITQQYEQNTTRSQRQKAIQSRLKDFLLELEAV